MTGVSPPQSIPATAAATSRVAGRDSINARRPDWFSTRELRERLIAAGVAEAQLSNAVAWYCRWRGLIATGFGSVHNGDETVRGIERSHVPDRVWRVFQAADKPELECSIGWDAGQFTWVRAPDDAPHLQETWSSVHFDRVSVDSIIWDLERQADVGTAYGWEVEAWIRAECRTENSKEAWAAYRKTFGKRAGKKSLFEARWREVKQRAGRGRLRKTDPPP